MIDIPPAYFWGFCSGVGVILLWDLVSGLAEIWRISRATRAQSRRMTSWEMDAVRSVLGEDPR